MTPSSLRYLFPVVANCFFVLFFQIGEQMIASWGQIRIVRVINQYNATFTHSSSWNQGIMCWAIDLRNQYDFRQYSWEHFLDRHSQPSQKIAIVLSSNEVALFKIVNKQNDICIQKFEAFIFRIVKTTSASFRANQEAIFRMYVVFVFVFFLAERDERGTGLGNVQ